MLNLCAISRTEKLTELHRLLDKIAKQILVCENKTIKPWNGSIGEYKNYLRKKMISAGTV
jgi:ATP-binding cassette subfamily F protein 2